MNNLGSLGSIARNLQYLQTMNVILRSIAPLPPSPPPPPTYTVDEIMRQMYTQFPSLFREMNRMFDRGNRRERLIQRAGQSFEVALEVETSSGGGSEGSDPCSVCFEPFQTGEQAIRTVCDHVFHRKCLEGWVVRRMNCPLCRQEFTSVRR